MRVGVIFENSVRPDTTGTYVRRALGLFAEVEHLLPSDLVGIPRDAFDFFLAVDDGLSYQFPSNSQPVALWAIDTHLDFERVIKQSENARFLFCAQRDGVEKFRQAGIENAVWLPLACDPELHGQQAVEKQFDVAFVGNIFPGPRHDLLARISQMTSLASACDLRHTPEKQGFAAKMCQGDRGTQWVTRRTRICGSVLTDA